MPKTSLETTAGWKTISWRKLERKVFKLQKRIFRASVRGDIKTVRQLQKTLIQSRSARCLALRKVTRENKNAGIKPFSSEQKIKLVENLKLGKKPKLFRKKSISLVYDRALQVLVRMALEPDREARFTQYSSPNLPYKGGNVGGEFRLDLSERDAIKAIYFSINKQSKYVLSADISECFDRIESKAVLPKLNTYPKLRRQIKTWLKSGKSTAFPLLVDIALQGLQDCLVLGEETSKIGNSGQSQFVADRGKKTSLKFISYGKKFVVLHEDLTVIQQCQQIISQWLGDMEWELKPGKIGISHTLKSYLDRTPGFDFLGFNIRQINAGKHYSARDIRAKKNGFKTIIEPSKESVLKHWGEINILVGKHKSASQANLIDKLVPKIQAWVNYYHTINSKEVFGMLDTLMWNKLRAWAKRRHPKKSTQYWIQKYWHRVGSQNWVFASKKDGKIQVCLPKYARLKMELESKTKGSPVEIQDEFNRRYA